MKVDYISTYHLQNLDEEIELYQEFFESDLHNNPVYSYKTELISKRLFEIEVLLSGKEKIARIAEIGLRII